MTAPHRQRDLHPVAWWLWAVGLAAFASSTTNPWLLLLLDAVLVLVVMARRGTQPWARSFRLYVVAAILMIVIRVGFRLIFGPRGWDGVVGGAIDGLRLGAIVLCVGAANALANPKRLLKAVPPALYEVGTALVVAVTVVPQLVESGQRVRAAQALRAGPTGRLRGMRRLLVPVLEDALERSLALAAGMDLRGYGRSGGVPRRERVLTGGLMLTALVGIAVGCYGILDGTAPRWIGVPFVLVGLLAAVGGLLLSGTRVGRTVYRPDPWRWPETAVVFTGVVVGTVGWWLAHRDPLIAYPDPLHRIPVTTFALVGLLVGALPAVVSPLPKVAVA